jgi:hypothetical protein
MEATSPSRILYPKALKEDWVPAACCDFYNNFIDSVLYSNVESQPKLPIYSEDYVNL